ncbi:MAG: ADP-ribosylglycohydrolase family protein [Leptolyngbyaceae cyanobacterium CSU_1_3]|nr:ADP-ribosylglycohydrolase family protein [Leptolyngbyaceae cyanobacterium CSU_1_3]
MQYALLNRFQATLLGAVLGEMVGETSDETWRQPAQGTRTQLPSSFNWRTIAPSPTLPLQTLTQFYLQDLLQPSASFSEIAASPEATGQAAIALLPTLLFFHEDRLKLWKQLRQAVDRLQNSSIDLLGVYAIGSTIVEILHERFDPLTLIPQLLSTLKPLDHQHQAPLIEQLQQVQTLLEQQAGLEAALRLIPRRSEQTVAIALYCFLSTPEDFGLALMRAARSGRQVAVVCTIVGALSGAHNGLNGITIAGRLAADSWQLTTGEARSQSELLNQADRLLALWSGVYNPTLGDRSTYAVAAPQVIRKFG